ncbi:MAG: sulfurtransferase TusA family protein [Anaerolineales bacterium]|nr:sulfurtransferase TusA family protein [Anaerolineales bacterium]
MEQGARPDKTADFSGLRCPRLVIAIIHTLTLLQPNQILQVTADDLNAPSSVAAWCRQSDHELLEMVESNGRFTFTIRYRPTQPTHE